MKRVIMRDTERIIGEFAGAGVRGVELRPYNPRVVGLPLLGALDLSASLPGRGNANGMAYRAMRDHARELQAGWTGLAHPREDIGWVVALRLSDFAHLMGRVEDMERGQA